MFDPARHTPLDAAPWNASEAEAAIDEIAADAIGRFDAQSFWPAHPQDDGVEDGDASVYYGAAGMIWALDYLQRNKATKPTFDFRPTLPHLLERTRIQMSKRGSYADLGSLLFGDLGAALVGMRLAPSSSLADTIHARVAGNANFPVRELMWGTPGSMIACLSMSEMTGEPRWRAQFEIQAARVLGELIDGLHGPMWTQDLYGEPAQYLGPVHGYAGNMIPLLRGWTWLDESQRARVADAVPRTLAATVLRDEQGCAWPPRAGGSRYLCQHCHGAPGMVTTFADAPFTSPELEQLLIGGGELTWAAGPLAKGSNLCHGTGGNGYALLKLYRRTKDQVWLDRARSFAMAAIAQCRAARVQLGRGRYSVWTGDIGLAIYLWDCLRAEARFPTVDVF